MHRPTYSQSQHKGSRLKTAWGPGQLAWTPPACPPACTRLLFQPLFSQRCSPLRGRLPLPTRVCTLGEMPALPLNRLETATASLCFGAYTQEEVRLAPWCGDGHRQSVHPCIHSEGSEASSRAPVPMHTSEGVGPAQRWAPTQPLTKACILGEKVKPAQK